MSLIATRYGEFNIIDTDSVISGSLRLYGEWAQHEIDLLAYFIQPGSVVIDVGAFIGTHARAFSALVGATGKVLAFEPRQATGAVLIENARLSPIANIRVINSALGSAEKTITVHAQHIETGDNFGALILEPIEDKDDSGEKVAITTLDAYKLDRLAFIKIDVEGMELYVLNGAKETVERCRPVIFAECNSLEASVPIIMWCQEQNYIAYGVLSPAYNEHNYANNRENIFSNAQETGLLLIPREFKSQYDEIISRQHLPKIETADDLALLLLHKPQYPYEVLAHAAAAANLTLAYPSQQADMLNQAVAERDGQIGNLNLAVAERDGQIAQVKQLVAERDIYIKQLVSSKSWTITKPIRWLGRVIRGDYIAAMDPFKKALRLTRSVADSSSELDIAVKEPQTSSANLKIQPIKPTHPVAVILPVYRGVEMTRRCILAAMPGILFIPDARLIIINDASPDTGMQEMLEEVAVQWPNVAVVLRNEGNLGFVGTVNRGFAYFPQHDAVLLNSDVIVPKNWLGRLIDEAYSSDKIGTVTPFSNNATICSFPHFLQENAQPFNLDVDTIDTVFSQTRLPCIETPTGIGFCMYIRRACLYEIGYLNQEKFGRGYGEENDLCQRALENGWLNIITPNIYAYHEGAVSFSSDKHALIDRAMRVLDDLHPHYHRDVQTFIRNDPVKSLRVARYIQLLSSIAIPKVLHVSHAVGGGVGQHVEELSQYFKQNIAHILLTPHDGENSICINLVVDQHADKLIFAIPSGYADLVHLLKSVGVSAVHFHHTHGLNAKIIGLATDLGVSKLLTVHDFYWLNANPTLTDENGKYQGYYSDTQINPLYPLPEGLTPADWQEQLRPLIENADSVIFPSYATKALFDNVYHPANVVVAPHVEAQLIVDRIPSAFTKKNSYIIGVLGAVGKEKGADLLEQIAVIAKNLNLPLKFKLIGYAYRSLKIVETTGPYKTKDLSNLIHTHGLDLIFFPAQWPETYSYTLSYALDSGLPIIAPNIGAFPERLSGRQNTLLFDHLAPASELFVQFNEFVEKLSSGALVSSPTIVGYKSKLDFYALDYLPLVSRDLKTVKNGNAVLIEHRAAYIVSGVTNNKALRRETLLLTLWRLQMNPSLRWVSHAIPHSARRAVRRVLSKSSIHDIVQGPTRKNE